MGSRDDVLRIHPREVEVFQPRKRFKPSELPLSATQRSTIDELLHTIKKKGEYDTLRKQVWSDFVESDAKNEFTNQLNELADAEIDRDPSFLSRDRGKAATLLQGAVDRSDIYKSVEHSLDRLVSEHLNHVLAIGREIRRAEIGEDAAAEEERRGNITDEDYAKSAAAKREAREQQRKQDEARRRREEERERVRADFAQKEAELQRLKKREEERLEREAKKQRQKEEIRKREEERNEYRKREEEKLVLGQREEERTEFRRREGDRHERLKEHDGRTRNGGGATPLLAEIIRERSRSRHRSSGSRTRSDNMSPMIAPEKRVEDTVTPSAATPLIDEAEVEREALEKLLREGAELAAKSGTKPQQDHLESIEPPHRRAQALKPKPSNMSPAKSVDTRSPMRSESTKPALNFSSINTRPNDPPVAQQPQCRTPPTGPKSQLRYHSLSRSDSRPNENRRESQAAEDKTTMRLVTASSNIHEPFHNAVDSRAPGHQTKSIVSENTRERERSRGFYHEDKYSRSDQARIRRRDYNVEERKSSRHDRSRSRGPRDRSDTRPRHREYDREDRDHRHDRSRSPYTIYDAKHHSMERKDSKETLLDSYKPRRDSLDSYKVEDGHRQLDHASKPIDETKETLEEADNESRRKYDESHRERRNDRDKEWPRREEDRYRDRDRERRRDDREDREHTTHRERHDDRARSTEYHRHDDRQRDRKERDRDPDKDRKDDRWDRDRERYRDRRDDRRDKDRDDYKDELDYRDRDGYKDKRDHRDRDSYKDERDHRDRDSYKDERDHRDSRGKDRRDEGGRDRDRDRDHDRGGAASRGYVTIDRYMPSSGSRDDTKRTRERDRDRDR